MDGVMYSVVVPLYKSEGTIVGVVGEIAAEFYRIDVDSYEIVLVNDNSPDQVLEVALHLAKKNTRVCVLDLAKNVGQVNAMLAGFTFARGDYIVSMDDDMQTPGYEIGKLIGALHERDDDVVFASYREVEGKRSLFRRLGTRLNWWMAEWMTKKPREIQTNSFFIMRRHVRDAYVAYADRQMYPYGVIFECTDRVSNVMVDHRPRAQGSSGYSLRSLFRLWQTGAMSFSLAPLRFATASGVAMLIVSLVGMVVSLAISRFYIGLFFAGCLLVGLQLLSMGLLGEYVGRIFMTESKLPRYVVREVIRDGERDCGTFMG